MKFTSITGHIAHKLSIVNRATAPKSTLSMLSNIKIKALKSNKIHLLSTNLQYGISTTLGAQVDEVGEIAIPGALITNFVSSLTSEKVNFADEKGSLKIETDEGWASLRGVGTEDFPPVKEAGGEEPMKLDSVKLRAILGGVLFAAAVDESRPILTGILIQTEDGTLKLVGVDGFRLSEATLKTESFKEKINVVIPARSLQELSRLLAGTEEVRLSYFPDENQVVFEVGDFVLSSRLLEGSFPEYKQIIPDNFKLKASLPVGLLRRSIQRSSLFSEANSNVVRLNFYPDRNEITVTAAAQDVGDTEMKIPAQLEGEEATIAFNARYLNDVLSYFESTGVTEEGLVEVNIKDAVSPGLFRLTNDTEYLHIVMPVRLQ